MGKKRIIYGIGFLFLAAVEVLIALFIHDRFLRPYGGDILVMGVLYCLVRVLFPEKPRWLSGYLFLFAVLVEFAQGLDMVGFLGLADSSFFSILLGTTFSWADILCYAIGSGLCALVEGILTKSAQRKK